MAAIDSINSSWGGHTGEEVQNVIVNTFNSQQLKIDNMIKDISIEKDDVYVKYTITKGDNTTVEKLFELTLPSSKTIYLTKFNARDNRVYTSGSLDIEYGFYVNEDGVGQVAGVSPTITLTIENGSLSTTYEAGRTKVSYASGIRTGSFTVPAEQFYEGINKITIRMSYLEEGKRAAFGIDPTYDDNITGILNIAKFTPKLSSRLEVNNVPVYEQLYNDETIVGTFEITDGNGANIGSYSNTVVSEYGVKYFSSDGQQRSLDAINYFNTGGNGAYLIYVLGYVNLTDGTTIYTNIDKYQFLSSATDYPNATRYAYKIAGIYDFRVNLNGTLSATNNRVKANQYSRVTVPIYAVGSNSHFIWELTNDQILEIYNENENVNGEYKDISIYQKQLLNEGENSVGVYAYGTSGVSVIFDTQKVGEGISLDNTYDLFLSADGKEGENNSWTYNNITTTFSNFDWSANGWKDNNLVVNNNARVVINYQPFSEVVGKSGRTISFRFKTTNENTEEAIISCHEQNRDGFVIYPQKAVVYKGTQSVSTQFTTEDNYKEVTFVWYSTSYGDLTIIYVNGTSQVVLSGGTSVSSSAKITITGNNTTVYLDKVTAYKKALNFSLVQGMYITNKSLNVSEYLAENAIFGSNVTLGYNGNLITPSSLPVGSRYMLINAYHSPTGPNKPWEVINKLDSTATVGNESTETKSWRLLAGETYLITKTDDGSGDPYNFYADKIALSGQGTSSMKYPIKNFRIYFKKKITDPSKTSNPVTNGNTEGFGDLFQYNENGEATVNEKDFGKMSYTTFFKQGTSVIAGQPPTNDVSDSKKYKMHSDAVPTDVFCLKADFAESSGMHNTGFARMADYALENSASISNTGALQDGTGNLKDLHKLPQNRFNEVDYKVRSTVDGIPVYLFFADKSGNITYHGKYNLNNEKATSEIFGFSPVSTDGYFDAIKDESARLTNLFKTGASDDVTSGYFSDTHETYSINDVTYVNPNECWEFSTNDADNLEHGDVIGGVLRQIGAFTFPYISEDGRTALQGFPYSNKINEWGALNPFTERTKNGKLAWLNSEQAWEYRFPDFDDDSEGNIKYSNGTVQPYLLKSLYKWVHRNNVYCWNDANKPSHAEVFARDLHMYFNVNYLLKYYVLTKWFICADQRIKNCMLAFLCDPDVESNDGENEGDYPMGKMRAFYIFYDNDTILGVNNTGSLTNSWDSGETNGVFQGIDSQNKSFHGIWGNLEYCYNKYINNDRSNINTYNLGKLIDKTYLNLRNALSTQTINSYLNSSLPDAADNVDAEVKYFFPTHLNSTAQDFDQVNLVKYQGNRKYHREWLLDKRTKWFDAKYGAGSIDDYYIRFKTSASELLLTSDIIRVTSAFKEWKFYLVKGDSANTIDTGLLNVNEIGTLSPGKIVNSNDTIIKGLFGASSIDLSNFYGNEELTQLDSIYFEKKLPYVTEFKIGNADGNLWVNNTFENFVKAVPNIQTLTALNIKSSSPVSLNLTDYNKLTTINASGSDLDITLPKGSELTSIILTNPAHLAFEGNINLNTININTTTNVTSYSAKHSSNVVYNYVLNAYNQSNGSATLTVQFGTNSEKDSINDDVITKLVTLANNIKNGSVDSANVSITGQAYNPNITSELKSLFYNAFGANLSITGVDTDEFSLIFEQGDQLFEDSTLSVTPTLKVDNWSIVTVSDPDNIVSGYVSIKEQSPYICVLQANPCGNNQSYNATIKLRYTHNQVEEESEPIYVKYIAATSLSITGELIIKSTSSYTLSTNGTKSYLLNTGSNVSITSESGTIGAYNTETCSFNYTPSENSDTTITATLIGGVSRQLTVYYDKLIISKTIIAGDNKYAWMPAIFGGEYGNMLENIYRSTLANITVTTNNGQLISNGSTSQLYQNYQDEPVQDLTNLQYFKANGQFTVPYSFKWDKLSIPEGVTSVDWGQTYGDSYTGYGTVTFPSTTTKVRVNLNVLSLPADLQFDISKATKITKIFNENVAIAATSENTFNISLTVNNNINSVSKGTKTLFVYNNNITQIGNYSETINGAEPSTMFNIVSDGVIQTGSAVPMYSLGSVGASSDLKVGTISKYVLREPAFDWGAIASRVVGLYYTFYNNSGLPSSESINFTKLRFIGDYTFGSSATTAYNNYPLITFSDNTLTGVGAHAFENYSGTLSQFTQENIKQIGNHAFNQMFTTACTFNLKNLLSIGQYAFLSRVETSKYTINIEQTTALSIGTNGLGTDKKNDVIVSNAPQGVKDIFNAFSSQVNLSYVDN